MPKMRINEVAKQYNKTSEEVNAALKQNRIEVQSHMSTIKEENIEKIKPMLGAGKDQSKKAVPERNVEEKSVDMRQNKSEKKVK